MGNWLTLKKEPINAVNKWHQHHELLNPAKSTEQTQGSVTLKMWRSWASGKCIEPKEHQASQITQIRDSEAEGWTSRIVRF